MCFIFTIRIALLLGEPDRHFPCRQLRPLEGQGQDRLADRLRQPVPGLAGSGLGILQGGIAAFPVPRVPAVERRLGNPQPIQGAPHRR